MRKMKERTFRTDDGCEIFFRHWPPEKKSLSAGAVVLLHRGHEHGGRLAHLVDEFDLPAFHFFAWDQRGLGRSSGDRGYAPSFARLVQDLDAFIRQIRRKFDLAEAEIAVIGQSVGAVLGAVWVHDYAPRIRAMVLASPAFRIKLYVPLARQGLRAIDGFKKRAFVNSYVKPRLLTHDPERIKTYKADPLIVRPIAINVLLGMQEAASRVVADAAAIRVPTQILVSGSDWVVRKGPQRRFFQRLGSLQKELHEFPGFFHDTLGERDRKAAVSKARSFLLKCFEAPVERRTLLDADKAGYTRDEYAALLRPLPALSPRRLYWAITRTSMKSVGRLSEGIRLGWQMGFDSGAMLDYIYRNRPSGTTPAGKAIDREYLNSAGWRGIRTRKRHLVELIRLAIDRLHKDLMPVHVVDVAAGHGRYVLEAIEGLEKKPDSVLLRDFSSGNVAAGSRLINEKGLGRICQFETGDAFNRESLAAIQPRPTLGIVSGLYELFPQNKPVLDSLMGLHDAIEDGGFLIYTNQPWHPQLELIARVLTSHRKKQPWVMRRRTQREMDELVAEAGFEKIDERIDEWGIFSVSLAVHRPRLDSTGLATRTSIAVPAVAAIIESETVREPSSPGVTEKPVSTSVEPGFAERQQRLLTEPLVASWQGPGEGRKFAAAANVGLFASLSKPPVVPDVFLSLDAEVTEDLWSKNNQSYFFWEFGKSPEIVIEIVTGKEGGEAEAKFLAYQLMRIPHYVIFDPKKLLSEEVLTAFVLHGAFYQKTQDLWFEEAHLGLAFWTGTVEGMEGTWLRWCDRDGRLIIAGFEKTTSPTAVTSQDAITLENERQRAEAERKRADEEHQRAERFRAKLKALGIDPDSL